MYQAKDAGRNTVRFFTNDLNFLLSKRLEIEDHINDTNKSSLPTLFVMIRSDLEVA